MVERASHKRYVEGSIPSAGKSFWLAALVLAGAVFLAYSSAIPNEFLYGDDEHIIVKNQYLREARHWPRFFTENLKAGFGQETNFYRPLQLLYYALLMKAVGPAPWVFHLGNVLWHALSAIFVLFLLRALFPSGRPWMLALLSALWALHPLQVEDIAGINGSATPMHLTFLLLGSLFFIRGLTDPARLRWPSAGLICYGAALLSKEAAIVLPGLLLVIHGAYLQERKWAWPPLAALLRIHGPFWILGAVYVLARLTALNFGGTLDFYETPNIYTQHVSYRFYTLLTVLGHGLSLMVWPRELHPERSWPVFASLWEAPVMISAAVLGSLAAMAWAARKKWPYFSLGIAWFFISYAPMSNLAAKINSLFWEHWLYVPMVGFIISLAALALGRPWLIRYLAAAVTCLAAVGAWATYQRGFHWRNSESYFRYVLTHEPGAARLWNNLAMALADRGDTAQAAQAYERALALDQSYPEIHHNLGQAYLGQGRLGDARARFEKALAINPAFYHSHLALANLDISAGNVRGAARHLEEALKAHPHHEGARRALEQLSPHIEQPPP